MTVVRFFRFRENQIYCSILESVTSSNNLSLKSATAKSSCQQQSQSLQPCISTSKARSSARYSGYHPHFRHHTTPAYYTDVDLRIHTPDAADVAALNENYRSVYGTSSQLVAGERYFPKTSTATVAPPPIGSGSGTSGPSRKTPTQQYAQAAFFRGASAASEPQRRKSLELYARSSPSSASPSKGDLNIFSEYANPEGSIISARLHLRPSAASSAAGILDTAAVGCTESAALPSPHHSRNSHRFSQRSSKRVVRVRSESRPISALYDIICKEKELDNGFSTTTTTDEDSSPRSYSSDDNDHDINCDNKSKDKDDRFCTSKRKKYNKSRAMSVNKLESPTSLAGPKTKNIMLSPVRNNNNNNNINHQHHEPSQPRSQYLSKKHHSIEQHASPIIHDLNTGGNVADDKQKTDSSTARKRSVSIGGANSKSNHSKVSAVPPYKLANEMMNQYHLQQQQEQRDYQQYARNDHPCHNHASHYSHPSNQIPSHCKSPSPPSADATKPNFVTIARSGSVDSYKGPRNLYSKTRPLYVEPVKLPESPEDSATNDNSSPERTCRRMAAGVRRRPLDERRRNTVAAVSMIPTAKDYRCIDAEKDSANHADSVSGGGGGLGQSSGGTRRFITRPNRTTSRGRNSLNGRLSSPQRSASSSPSPSPPVFACTISPAKGTDTEISPATEPQTDAEIFTISIVPGLKISNDSVMTNSPASNTAAAAVPATSSPRSASAVANRSTIDSLSDKKKDEPQQPQRFSTPSSPHRLAAVKTSPRRHSSSSDQQATANRSSTGTSSESDRKNVSHTSPSKRRVLRSAGGADFVSPATKKLSPNLPVSAKQNHTEVHCNGSIATPPSPRTKQPNTQSIAPISEPPKTLKLVLDLQGERTVNVMESAGTQTPPNDLRLSDDDASDVPRPRCSTMQSEKIGTQQRASDVSNDETEALSPVPKSKNTEPTTSNLRVENRDKSSKRKSNLNRSTNAEATKDSDDAAAMRRRRRRELGMARQLIPPDEPGLREVISPQRNAASSGPTSPKANHRNTLAFHMENARRGLDLIHHFPSEPAPLKPAIAPERCRPNVPHSHKTTASAAAKSETRSPLAARRHHTLPHSGSTSESRKLRSNDVNRKVNERTKSDLAEIKKIAERVSDDQATTAPTAIPQQKGAEAGVDMQSPRKVSDPPEVPTQPISRIPERVLPSAESTAAEAKRDLQKSPRNHRESSPRNLFFGSKNVTPATSVTFDNGSGLPLSPDSSNRQRLLKARSAERDEGTRVSPTLRRTSAADEACLAIPPTPAVAPPATSAHNHIVSILKKNSGESSSASSNASPVTFSANVLDTPTRQKRVGILKKRSSLDESRYYSRSHSPDERSILIKSARRNSLEETAGASGASPQHHGILKQSSYDSCKSDGCPSATELQPHGILKKKDSTSTPSDGGSHSFKHVSISQAVILAAAELCKDSLGDAATGEYDESGGSYTPATEDYDLRPILKVESTSSDDAMRPPKPILKKKSSSGDSDEPEIRPILKTSRKSSREEFDMGDDNLRPGNNETNVRPILKTESPSKRRSLGNSEIEDASSSQLSMLQRRTRSLERQGGSPTGLTASPGIDLAAALNAIGPQYTSSPLEFVTRSASVSVADRIRCMEKFLKSTPTNITAISSDDGWRNEFHSTVDKSSDSPLQFAAMPKLYRPSAIKREVFRERYKTQPVTSEEKKILKNTSLSFECNKDRCATSTGSAASGSKSKPLSPPPPPPPKPKHKKKQSIVFKATKQSSAPSSPTETTTPTAPTSIAADLPSGSVPINTPQRFQSSNNNNNQKSSDCELTFEMSNSKSKDDGSNARMQEDKNRTATETPPSTAAATAPEASRAPSIQRKSSVREKANMFAQLQERNKNSCGVGGSTTINREERSSPKRGVYRNTSASYATPTHDDFNTSCYQSMNTDEDFEPSLLPVSERLRFFKSLTENSNNTFSSFNGTRDSAMSYERSASVSGYTSYFTPRSSISISINSGSSSSSTNSITPTPMECSSATTDVDDDAEVHDEDDSRGDSDTTNTSISTTTSTETTSTDRCCMDNGRDFNKAKLRGLKKSSSQSTSSTADVARAAANIAALTPTAKRIKLKTIGKLMLPQNFLNANNRNSSNSSSCEVYQTNNSSDAAERTLARKIGKIKSPFIENCQQLQQKQPPQAPYTSKCMKYCLRSSPCYKRAESDSKPNGGDVKVDRLGKENIDSGPSVPMLAHAELQSLHPPIDDIRNKFTRIISGSNISNATATPMRLQQPKKMTKRHSLGGTTQPVHERYAKYFGVVAKPAVHQSPTEDRAVSPPHVRKASKASVHVGATPKRRDPVRRSRAMSSVNGKPPPSNWLTCSPTANAGSGTPTRAGRAGRSFTITNGVPHKQLMNEVEKFEDIAVTKEEFRVASKEFERLFLSIA